MPRLLIQVGLVSDAAAALSSFRRLTGMPILELTRALSDGTLELEFRTDQNDHDEVAAKIRDVLATLASLQITPTIFELYDDDENLRPHSRRSLITADIVENLLVAWDETQQALRREDDLRLDSGDDT